MMAFDIVRLVTNNLVRAESSVQIYELSESQQMCVQNALQVRSDRKMMHATVILALIRTFKNVKLAPVYEQLALHQLCVLHVIQPFQDLIMVPVLVRLVPIKMVSAESPDPIYEHHVQIHNPV